jgi:hypothetical protein
MDYTYKTNRYNMPLLHFLEVSPIGKYFSVGFCFLNSKTEEDYNWIIQQFAERILPPHPDGSPRAYQAPSIILTNNKAALKLALTAVLSESIQLLYI